MTQIDQLLQLISQTSNSGNAILTRREAAREAGFSTATLDRRVRDGSFPRPLRLSVRRVGWLRSAIEDWKSQLGDKARHGCSR
jgi:prophage regulatory protein